MDLTILVILVPIVILGAAGFVTFRLIRGQHQEAEVGTRRLAEIHARMAQGTPARATVVQSRSIAAMPGRGSAAIEITLEVEAPVGAKYQAKTMWEIDLVSLSRVQPGQVLMIKIDPQEPGTIYPGESWAKPYSKGG
jgi:hypothetical protein